jgi:hypothetical protein
MACRLFLMAVHLLAFADQALANWWIVRDASDEKCLVVDLEPTGNDKTVTKVGEVYQTPQQAEADVKRLCKESKAEDRPARDPGNAE